MSLRGGVRIAAVRRPNPIGTVRWRRASASHAQIVDDAAFKLYFWDMTGRELLKVLREAGWLVVGVRGSHHKLVKGELTVIVPVHGKGDIPTGTLHAILRQTGLELKR